MKKNLLIEDYEDKKTKDNKRYVRFKTSDGWMSCFDSVSNDALKAFEGKTACVEVTTSGDFSNIKKCYGVAEEISEVAQEEVKAEVFKPGAKVGLAPNKSTTMYVSYAKDIFCEIYQEGNGISHDTVMGEAIKLVKQAKEAFE